LSGNSAAADGGCIHADTASLTNSTVSGNDAANADDEVHAPANNLAGGNILGTNVFQGNVDVGDTTAVQVFAATVNIGGSVLAGVLADNGSPVQTIALKRTLLNPALDASSGAAPANDARGEARVDWQSVANGNGSAADLGAFELQNKAPSITSDAGGAAAAVSVAENSMAVTTAVALDQDGDAVSFSLAGGADAALFAMPRPAP